MPGEYSISPGMTIFSTSEKNKLHGGGNLAPSIVAKAESVHKCTHETNDLDVS